MRPNNKGNQLNVTLNHVTFLQRSQNPFDKFIIKKIITKRLFVIKDQLDHNDRKQSGLLI